MSTIIFLAIFAGVNWYKFTKVLPIVSHSCLREIVLHEHHDSIEYRVTDLDVNNAIERFALQLNKLQNRKHFVSRVKSVYRN